MMLNNFSCAYWPSVDIFFGKVLGSHFGELYTMEGFEHYVAGDGIFFVNSSDGDPLRVLKKGNKIIVINIK